jgi:hypothetical protein
VELPGRGHKFELPPKYIKSSADEFFHGLKESAKRIKQLLKK